MEGVLFIKVPKAAVEKKFYCRIHGTALQCRPLDSSSGNNDNRLQISLNKVTIVPDLQRSNPSIASNAPPSGSRGQSNRPAAQNEGFSFDIVATAKQRFVCRVENAREMKMWVSALTESAVTPEQFVQRVRSQQDEVIKAEIVCRVQKGATSPFSMNLANVRILGSRAGGGDTKSLSSSNSGVSIKSGSKSLRGRPGKRLSKGPAADKSAQIPSAAPSAADVLRSRTSTHQVQQTQAPNAPSLVSQISFGAASGYIRTGSVTSGRPKGDSAAASPTFTPTASADIPISEIRDNAQAVVRPRSTLGLSVQLDDREEDNLYGVASDDETESAYKKGPTAYRADEGEKEVRPASSVPIPAVAVTAAPKGTQVGSASPRVIDQDDCYGQASSDDDDDDDGNGNTANDKTKPKEGLDSDPKSSAKYAQPEENSSYGQASDDGDADGASAEESNNAYGAPDDDEDEPAVPAVSPRNRSRSELFTGKLPPGRLAKYRSSGAFAPLGVTPADAAPKVAAVPSIEIKDAAEKARKTISPASSGSLSPHNVSPRGVSPRGASPSAPPASTSPRGLIDANGIQFNQQFQEIVTKLYSKNDEFSRMELLEELIRLSNDFVGRVKTYGRILISEYCLPPEGQTFKPVAVGGVIGGKKYIVQNILFKFAVDEKGVFGNRDEFAAKIAGLEMKAIKACSSQAVKDLHYPLTALLDHKGYRVIASSVLSLGTDSLCCGSDDAGQTVKATNSALVGRMSTLGRKLNLKPHMVKERKYPDSNVNVPLAIDAEGHYCAADKRFYLLDLSRVFPPVRPAKDVPGGYLFQLFRPQFVAQYPIPLCSDAYSNFTQGTPDHAEHKREINAATEYLFAMLIPKFAAELVVEMDEELRMRGSLKNFRLTETLHAYGINVRYLGLVFQHVASPQHQLYVLAEMAARIIKNDLRSKMRSKLKATRLPLDEPFRVLVSEVLNLAFGNSSESQSYWNEFVVPVLMVQFYLPGAALKNRDLRSMLFWNADAVKDAASTDLNAPLPVDFRLYILDRVLSMTGVVIGADMQDFLEQNPDLFMQATIFDESDILDIGERVKYLDIVTNARAFVYLCNAETKEATGNKVGAKRLYLQSLENLEESLNSSPTDVSLILSTVVVLLKLYELVNEEGLLGQAERYLRKAIGIDRDSDTAYFLLARIHEKQGDLDEAEVCILQSLLVNPNNEQTVEWYAKFLRDKKEDAMAAKFEKRLQEIKEKK